MSQERLSKLSFSIEESVWLNKDQEIKEIISMSLEPEITIEEREQHVYIKGGLRLLGEYRTGEDAAELSEEKSLEEQLSFRSVEEMSTFTSSTGQIKHYFPIDVTIPLNRIQKLDDVYVQVESFDYDIPEKSCIQLTADVSISGMSQPEQEVPVEEPVRELEQAPILEAVPTSFSFEAKKQPDIEMAPPPSSFNARMEEDVSEKSFKVEPAEKHIHIPPVQQRQAEEEEYEEPAFVEESAPEESPEEAEEIGEETLRADEDEIVEAVEEPETAEEPEISETKINLAPLKEMVRPKEIVAAKTVKAEKIKKAETKVVDTEREPEEKPSLKEENALYLTKMLAREEERFLKWKMCIIQQNESLDIIAERYDVTTSQLVRINRLEQEQVEEGQILYIPVTAQS
ncbi:stage VI sporulation protein D [Bacillus solitudinis]|uniref:stage VI sporulation protein D n=1 Tax=Bacillus solitudinis TaxID=2014074 RepID=UPI0012FDB6A5|nr:stage VI sporulation protein D [Bacillus solitudinis]